MQERELDYRYNTSEIMLVNHTLAICNAQYFDGMLHNERKIKAVCKEVEGMKVINKALLGKYNSSLAALAEIEERLLGMPDAPAARVTTLRRLAVVLDQFVV